MTHSIPLMVFLDVSLKVKQVVLPSFRLSFRVVQTSSLIVKQLVLLLKVSYASIESDIYAKLMCAYII